MGLTFGLFSVFDLVGLMVNLKQTKGTIAGRRLHCRPVSFFYIDYVLEHP